MEHDWIKATFIPAVVAKSGTRQIWRIIFKGGHLLHKAVQHQSWTKLVIIFIWIDKVHTCIVNNLEKIIWIFTIANWRNVDLTEKQHSRHRQFLRIPLSPLEASSWLPRSCHHLFSHSMSKASLPQGPDMWYLTFYENNFFEEKWQNCYETLSLQLVFEVCTFTFLHLILFITPYLIFFGWFLLDPFQVES